MDEATELQALKYRRSLGLSQSKMAELMGDTSPMTVSKWETGKREPRAQAVELMRLLVWLHDNHNGIYHEWVGVR